MPTVFVIGEDWNLRAMVRAELRELGVEALGMKTVEEAVQTIAEGTLPDAVVLDARMDVASRRAAEQMARRFPMALVASRTGNEITLPGATLLWRPVRVGDVVACVKHLLEGCAA